MVCYVLIINKLSLLEKMDLSTKTIDCNLTLPTSVLLDELNQLILSEKDCILKCLI